MSRWRTNKKWMKRYFNKIVRRTAAGNGHNYRKVIAVNKEGRTYMSWFKRNKYQRGDENDQQGCNIHAPLAG